MGRTYRGLRKQFGSRKTQQHRTRSKWSSQNGTRLRTLNVDLAEFMEHSEFGESLHKPHEKVEREPRRRFEAATPKQQTSQTYKAPLPTVEPFRPKLPTVEPFRPKLLEPVRRLVELHEVRTFLNGLSREALVARKEHASKQVSYLTKLLGAIQRELDDSFEPAIKRLTERKKYWDRQAGMIGPLLVERQP